MRYDVGSRPGGICEEAVNALEAMQSELTMRRKSGSASDRLHNLCEGIAADADGSEWSREEWERIEAENLELRNEVKRLSNRQVAELSNAEIDAISRVTAPVADASMLYVERQALWERTFARAVIAADRALRGEKA